jgi:hypothetical protein
MRPAIGVILALGAAAGPAAADNAVYVNAARDGESGRSAIETLAGERPRSAAHAGVRDALEGPLADPPDDAGTAIETARKLVAEAERRFRETPRDPAIRAKIDEARAALAPLLGSAAAAPALAEAEFLDGWIALEEKRGADAAARFRLTRALEPRRDALDPDAYLPRLVRAYEEAVAAKPRPVGLALVVRPARASVRIDGVRVEPVPGRVPAGRHYITATAVGYRPRTWSGKIAGSKTAVSIELEPLDPAERIAALRRALRDGGEAAELARDLAELAGGRRLVIVRDRAGGGLERATFADGRLGEWSPVARSKPADLRFRRPPANGGAVVGGPVVAVERRWYQKTSGKVAIGGGVAAVVAGAVLVYFAATAETTVNVGADWELLP